MTYRLLTGQFVIRYPEAPQRGPEPDGDTVKFRPDDPGLVEDLARISGTQPDLSAQHRISLRFEGVDTLETHFAGTHQQLALANAARDHTLAQLGFRDVVFFENEPNKVKSAHADQLPGWVLTNGVEAHGRLVAFVFTGTPPLADGAEVFLDDDLAGESLNAGLLATGMAYPMFYTTLPSAIRRALATRSTAARDAGAGVWAEAVGDPDHAPATVTGLADLERVVLWPKLFRRLVSFFAAGQGDLTTFDGWLRADLRDRDDALLLLDTGEVGNLHDVVKATADEITLTRRPEDFVVLPDPALIGRPATPAPRTSPVRIVAAVVSPDDGAAWVPESVTLLNATAADIDVTGWRVSDSAGRGDLLGTVIGAGDVRRVTLQAAQLGGRGDTILVRDAAGAVVDRVAYARRAVPLTPGATMTF